MSAADKQQEKKPRQQTPAGGACSSCRGNAAHALHTRCSSRAAQELPAQNNPPVCHSDFREESKAVAFSALRRFCSCVICFSYFFLVDASLTARTSRRMVACCSCTRWQRVGEGRGGRRGGGGGELRRSA